MPTARYLIVDADTGKPLTLVQRKSPAGVPLCLWCGEELPAVEVRLEARRVAGGGVVAAAVDPPRRVRNRFFCRSVCARSYAVLVAGQVSRPAAVAGESTSSEL
jgi:hypothetical protein